MKKCFSAIAKLGICLIVNLFAIISALFNVWEFTKMLVINIITKVPNVISAVLGTFAAIYTAYCIFTSDISSVGTKIFIIVMFFIVVSLLISISKLAISIVSVVLSFVIGILGAGFIIEFMRDSIFKLVNRYLSYCDGGPKLFERICLFGLCYVLNLFRKTIQAIGKIVSVIIYPLFATASGAAGYWLFFIYEEAPAIRSLEWWTSVAVIALLSGAGIYLAYLVNEATTESAEDSNFYLFALFEVCFDTLKNFSREYRI